MSKIQTPWKSVLLSPDNSSNSYQIGQQSINVGNWAVFLFSECCAQRIFETEDVIQVLILAYMLPLYSEPWKRLLHILCQYFCKLLKDKI